MYTYKILKNIYLSSQKIIKKKMNLLYTILILLLTYVESINLTDIFTNYGFDVTSSEMMIKYINSHDYQFFTNEYNLYLQKIENGKMIYYEFDKYFTVYKNESEFYNDLDNPLSKINAFAFELYNIQNGNIEWSSNPSVGFDDIDTLKTAIAYLILSKN